MANNIFKIGLGSMLGLFVAFGAAAQPDNRPANDAPNGAPNGAPRPLARDQTNPSDTAKKRQQDREARREDLSRDPDRSTIGPRTTQGLAQDAISRSNSR